MNRIVLLCAVVIVCLGVQCRAADVAVAGDFDAALVAEFNRLQVPPQVRNVITQRARAIMSQPRNGGDTDAKALQNIRDVLNKLQEKGFERANTASSLKDFLQEFFACPLFPLC